MIEFFVDSPCFWPQYHVMVRDYGRRYITKVKSDAWKEELVYSAAYISSWLGVESTIHTIIGVLETSQPRANTSVSASLPDVWRGPRPDASLPIDCMEFIVLFLGGPVEFLGGVRGTSQPRANTGVSGRLAEVCRGPRPPDASRFCRCNVRLRAPLAPISKIDIMLIFMEPYNKTIVLRVVK